MSEDQLRTVAMQSVTRNLQILALPNPAAGAELIVTPRAGEVWNVLGITATFTATAVVANRTPRMVLDDSTTVAIQYMTAQIFAATAVGTSVWCADYGQLTTNVTTAGTIVPIRQTILPAGWRLRTVTANIDVGDQWSGIGVLFERMDEPPYRNPLLGTAFDDMIEHEIQQRLAGG